MSRRLYSLCSPHCPAFWPRAPFLGPRCSLQAPYLGSCWCSSDGFKMHYHRHDLCIAGVQAFLP